MNIKNKAGFEFFHYEEGHFNIFFFTAANNANFSINSLDGIENLKKVKSLLGLEDIGHLRQIHSDIILEFDGKCNEGDALLTNRSNIGLGVFTADCVPVIIIDREKNAIAAIHSGWKGTFDEITNKTIRRMEALYKSNAEDLDIFIGPHIGECCYNVSAELIDKFLQKGYSNENIVNGDKLNLEKCIIEQCKQAGVKQEKIHRVNYCTMCSSEHKFYSYRKNKDNGRLFSLVYFNNK